MTLTNKTTRGQSTLDPFDELLDAQLRDIDAARAIPRPDGIDKFYVEEAFEKKAGEQAPLAAARGESDARPWRLKAAEFEYRARVTTSYIDGQREVVANARVRFELAARTLGAYTRRQSGEKLPYYLRWALILGGDVAGVAGAAILLGETVALGVLQAIASGTAAITGGLLAQEVRDSRLARKREKLPRELTDDERRFAHLFRGGDGGERIVKWIVAAAMLIGVLIAVSIFALRYSTEGSTAAWAFGLLAAGVALASWANVYHYTDEAADLIDARRADYVRELKRLKRLLKARDVSAHAAALAMATSIETEAANRGLAAQRAVEATGAHLLNEHADVAGHGWTHGPEGERHDHERHEVSRHDRRVTERQLQVQLPRIDVSIAYDSPPGLLAGAAVNGHQDPAA
jgi:hypothetical protein